MFKSRRNTIFSGYKNRITKCTRTDRQRQSRQVRCNIIITIITTTIITITIKTCGSVAETVTTRRIKTQRTPEATLNRMVQL